MTSNWADAERARVQAVIDAMRTDADVEIRERFEARGLCGIAEPDLPAPTMQRCTFPKNHQGEHSWAVTRP